ncbi:hypothetical protein JW877_05725, partial [bacterium]|nr:hypothetical protein [bacterium]
PIALFFPHFYLSLFHFMFVLLRPFRAYMICSVDTRGVAPVYKKLPLRGITIDLLCYIIL